MTIKINFMVGREILNFRIKGKEIYHSSRVFNKELRCIPKDEQYIRKIRESRNRYSAKLIDMFTLSESQQKEYDEAVTENDLAEIIIKDFLKKGITLMKKEVIDDELAELNEVKDGGVSG